MKRIITLLSSVLLTVKLWAQAPQSFSYQAVVRGTNNTLITNKSVGMRISLLQGSDTGNTVYVETQTPTANTNGLVSIAIGNGTVVSGMFSSIDWSKGPYFIKTETDPTGGANYSLTTVSQLLSVPYALYSGNGIQSVSKIGDTLFLANGKFFIIPNISAAQTKPTSGYGSTIKDIEGNSYKTVYIGNQEWMAENLRVSKYNDGTAIPNVIDNSQWTTLTSGAYAYYNNDSINNAIYGKLYNWFVVSPTANGNKNVCPTGWHAPSNDDWNVLTNYLGGDTIAGGKMKEVGTAHWETPNSLGTNSSLFTALPSGDRYYLTGNFDNLGLNCYWWCTTEFDQKNAWVHSLGYNFYSIHSGGNSNKNYGLSIRCIKD